MALRNCEGSHCSAVDAEINAVCKQEGWAVGHPVITRDSKGVCQCHCSCLALDTPVQAGDETYRAIQDFKVGDPVLAAGANLKWVVKEVEFSDGTTGDSVQPYTIFVEYGERSLIVTADHLFLMPNGKLKRADRLSTSDELVSPDGDEIQIRSVSMGTFYGGFHHIATTTEQPKNLDGHLLNTNGVVTADYALQLFYRTGELDVSMLTDRHDELPEIGSEAYVAQHGETREPSLHWKLGSMAVVGDVAERREGDSLFVPASRARLRIPDDAVGFISKKQARALEKKAKRPLTATDAQAWAEYLTTQYKAFYPDVIYEIDWYNNEVNAYAWIENGKRYVSLLGGLIRDPDLEIEGIALILAHELGHHYGGPPTYPNSPLSCEGQADFYGANNIMRVTWFGSFYYDVMIKAIAQMAKFFGAAAFQEDHYQAAALAGCSHPAGQCRVDTYWAAVDLKEKPACAG